MKKRVPVLIPFLAVVSAIFIGILIFAYVETKKANPQMLDENGKRLVGQVVNPGSRGLG
jgi:hypothetical protein